jgi:hypothetical protein
MLDAGSAVATPAVDASSVVSPFAFINADGDAGRDPWLACTDAGAEIQSVVDEDQAERQGCLGCACGSATKSGA